MKNEYKQFATIETFKHISVLTLSEMVKKSVKLEIKISKM